MDRFRGFFKKKSKPDAGSKGTYTPGAAQAEYGSHEDQLQHQNRLTEQHISHSKVSAKEKVINLEKVLQKKKEPFVEPF